MDQSDRLSRLLLEARRALAAARPKERRLHLVGSEPAPEPERPRARVLEFRPRAQDGGENWEDKTCGG